MQLRQSIKFILLFLAAFSTLGLMSCGGGGNSGGALNLAAGVAGSPTDGNPDDFRGAGIIADRNFLIGGPLAQGRLGDILLQNDRIRVIIQKPTRNTGVGQFGGNILDADIMRSKAEPGQDQFGTIFPLINLSWTANYQKLEIINGDFANGPVVVRATGILDVYDYIQTNIVTTLARASMGVEMYFDARFDDVFDPFRNVPDLRGLSPIIVTEYTLRQDAPYVMIETMFQNNSPTPVKMPVGDWFNGSGTLEAFAPMQGFLRGNQVNGAAAITYQGMEDDVGVSYGYFYNPLQYLKEDGTLRKAASMLVSGVIPVVLGEEGITNIIPLSVKDPEISFEVERGVRTITRYFTVGNGDIATVVDAGFQALGVSKLRLSGRVTDASGRAVKRAKVFAMDASNDAKPPVTAGYSDANGNFAFDVSSGRDVKDQLFGSGNYQIKVYKEGYVLGAGPTAGRCQGGRLNAAAGTFSGISCRLGDTAMVNVTATENGRRVPARITIVGFDPSPIHPDGDPGNFGKYADINLSERPHGVIDTLYLGPDGNIKSAGNARISRGGTFLLEPGEYEIFVTRGPEYSVYSRRINLRAGATANVNANLSKVVNTSGFVSADLHMHGIHSADSIWGLDSRVYAALGEGLDIVVSTDHDFVTDYAPTIAELGVGNQITSMAGDEITALALGHMLAFPLTPDPESTTGGAYDYTYIPADNTPGPGPDMGQTAEQIYRGVDAANPGTQVLQVAHILDKPTGNFSIMSLVTSTFFEGVEPLVTYSDPIRFRMPPNSNAAGNYQAPFPLNTSGMFSLNFTSLELIIGAYDATIFDHLMHSTLPVYFNLLNLGVIKTATGSSDSHTHTREPVGSPRNYIASSVDPRDAVGADYQAIDPEEIAVNTNAHRVIVSNGVFVRPFLHRSDSEDGVTVGGTVAGTGEVTLDLEVSSSEYFDWDTVEIYANTEPIPAKDDLSGPTELLVKEFHTASKAHIQTYMMSPTLVVSKDAAAGPLRLRQTVRNGLRRATVSANFNFEEDTWIVVVVKGSGNTRSLFPYVTTGIDKELVPQATFLDTLDADPVSMGGVPAFAFTNPMFVDVDDNGFEAKHIRDGLSPLAR